MHSPSPSADAGRLLQQQGQVMTVLMWQTVPMVQVAMAPLRHRSRTSAFRPLASMVLAQLTVGPPPPALPARLSCPGPSALAPVAHPAPQRQMYLECLGNSLGCPAYQALASPRGQMRPRRCRFSCKRRGVAFSNWRGSGGASSRRVSQRWLPFRLLRRRIAVPRLRHRWRLRQEAHRAPWCWRRVRRQRGPTGLTTRRRTQRWEAVSPQRAWRGPRQPLPWLRLQAVPLPALRSLIVLSSQPRPQVRGHNGFSRMAGYSRLAWRARIRR
mmetsp:Transcript_36564/g.94397  ORF Transcript_36564/g.94397 Transcript_36564/m.94397 type:complete len:270 (+) Transcript_36564:556-1365(+)